METDWANLTEEGYVEISEAAEQMNLSVRAVRAAVQAGVLRSHLIGGVRLVQPAIVSGTRQPQ
ncbi:hypothetical protein [Mycobacterium sp. UM_Kg1]|uniref:hypothetical protein n=1 Tax=Mycobacterium sp. UM_Kg1 TaxID=1545691 RepID=UPI00061B099F|nr:hypothetical protein [Mycobacterium sp. UM_Kg1]